MNVINVLQALQGQLRSTGNKHLKDVRVVQENAMITCPYHGNGVEKNPSCGVLLEDKGKHRAGTVHCFTCGTTTDLEHLVSDVFGINDNGDYGRKWLLENFGILQTKDNIYIPAFEDSIPTFEYKSYVGYHDYYRKRGVSEELAKAFNLGYDPYNETVVIPVFDKQGKCVMLIRRGTKSKVYMNSAGANKVSTLYGLNNVYNMLGHFVDYPYIFITEGAFDVLRLWQFGYPAVGILQATVSESHINLIKKLPFNKVVIATDNDEAGRRVAGQLAKKLGRDKEIFRVYFPAHAKDIGDFTDEEMEGMKLIRWQGLM